MSSFSCLLSENRAMPNRTYSPPIKKPYEPLDLSRRCDSVETMKTPSPCSLGEMSSPIQNHSSHTSHASHYPQSPTDFMATYAFQANKRDTPSPDVPFYGKGQECNLSPFMLQAALHQRLAPYPLVSGRDGKLARPFKAYPRDPLALASFSTVNAESNEKFDVYRRNMLKQIRAANGGQPTISNPKMRRVSSRAADCESTSNADSVNHNSDSSNSGVKDSAYYERRRKNNAAAKKSRDRRRIKEDEIAIRASFLESENRELQAELASSRKQLAEYKSELNAVRSQLAIYGVTVAEC